MIPVTRPPSLRYLLAGTVMLSALLPMSPIGDAQTTAKAPAVQSGTAGKAEELVVLSAVDMRQVLLALAPSFEREIGQKLAVSFDSGAAIGERVQRGEAADVIIVPRGVIDDLARAGRVQTASVVDVATSIVGLAVRKGAPKPDISSPEALMRTLLAARSIARPDPARGGSSGVHIAQVLARLGIAEELRSRTILASNPEREEEMPGAFVASGRAEIALHQVQELMAVTGIEIVGPLPGELRGGFLFRRESLREASGSTPADDYWRRSRGLTRWHSLEPKEWRPLIAEYEGRIAPIIVTRIGPFGKALTLIHFTDVRYADAGCCMSSP